MVIEVVGIGGIGSQVTMRMRRYREKKIPLCMSRESDTEDQASEQAPRQEALVVSII